MSSKLQGLSFCIPVYNEADCLIDKIREIQQGLKKILKHQHFELIVVENGSTDNTAKLVRSISNRSVRGFSIKSKGIGAAYRKAIKEARFNKITLSAIDLPFGFTDLTNAMKLWNDYDVIFGSKAHPDSKINVPTKRLVASQIYRILLKNTLSLPIKDTQGTVFFNKNKVSEFLHLCDADNAFFTAQLAVHAKRSGLGITEIPVKMKNDPSRSSKFSIFKDGKEMIQSLIKEYIKLKNDLT